MKLPNFITRLCCKISFKSSESLLRHVRTLLAAWNYRQGNPCRWRKRNAVREGLLAQRAGLKANHARHAEACRQGYAAKIILVNASKGHNTLSGIPA